MVEVRSDPEAPARRDDNEGDGATRGTARMEAFADAVFAIAFTLPVVEIVMPSVDLPGERLWSDLLAIWPSYLGYILASYLIGLYWVHHHFSGAIYRTTGHWFLIATVIFLTTIGFIAFPARAFAEHLPDPAAREAASQYFVLSLSALAVAWVFKWTVGRLRGQVDSRLDAVYIARLDRRYRAFGALNLAAAGVVFIHWEAGLAMSALLALTLMLPPETPRYITEAPIVEGET